MRKSKSVYSPQQMITKKNTSYTKNRKRVLADSLSYNEQFLLHLISNIGLDRSLALISEHFNALTAKDSLEGETRERETPLMMDQTSLDELYKRIETIEAWMEDQKSLEKGLSQIRKDDTNGLYLKDFPHWNQVLAKIQQKITAPPFDTWFAGTIAKFLDEDTIIVYSKNEFQSSWLETRYKDEIFFTIKEIAGISYDLEFGVGNDNGVRHYYS